MLCIFEIRIVYPKLNNFALVFFCISDLVHDEIISFDINAYKLQPSLIEMVVVDWHGCHTALHFCVKANENKDKFLRCTGYLNSIKNP